MLNDEQMPATKKTKKYEPHFSLPLAASEKHFSVAHFSSFF
jgi:hypothetical protein